MVGIRDTILLVLLLEHTLYGVIDWTMEHTAAGGGEGLPAVSDAAGFFAYCLYPCDAEASEGRGRVGGGGG